MATIRNILEEIGLPHIREPLGYLLGKEIPEETKEIKDAKNKIYIKIENTFSGTVFNHTMEFNRTDTIGDMKEQVKEFLNEHQGKPLYDFRFHNEYRQIITNPDTDTLDILYNQDTHHVLAVNFNTGNLLIKLLEKYPDKPWDWRYISRNPNITMEFIEKYPNKPWNWRGISANPNITMDIIEKYPDKPWKWHFGISRNPNLTIRFIERHNKPWDWEYICRNPNITIEDIEKYPDKPWDWEDISINPNITMEFIEKYPDKSWNWSWISYNPNITMEIIEKHPDKPWNWKWISTNPNITVEFIEKHMDKIYFIALSENKFTYQNKLNKINKGIFALENTKNRLPKEVNMYIINHYL